MTNTINDRDLPLPADIAENLENAVAIRRTLHKTLHDIRHAVHRFLSQLRRIGRNFTPAEELHSLLADNDLEHLLGTVAL